MSFVVLGLIKQYFVIFLLLSGDLGFRTLVKDPPPRKYDLLQPGGTYYNQVGHITTGRVREDLLQPAKSTVFYTKPGRGVWWSPWCPGPEESRGNVGCNKSLLGSHFRQRGWQLDRKWYISRCIDASMALPVAWSLCRPVRNPQPDGRALYDFVIGREATPSGGYSIPSYCLYLCVGDWLLIDFDLLRSVGTTPVSRYMCGCMFKPRPYLKLYAVPGTDQEKVHTYVTYICIQKHNFSLYIEGGIAFYIHTCILVYIICVYIYIYIYIYICV